MTATRARPTEMDTTTYSTDAPVEHNRHGRSQHRNQVAQGRDTPGPTRTCQHPRANHQHGTRAAYVRDRCRCRDCTSANTAASNAMHRSIAYGRWAPFVDATPVRSHLHGLRAAGIGIDRIASIAGLSSSHVRALIYPRSDGKPPFRKVRPDTAARLLAVRADAENRARHSRIDATGTRRRLQALIAVGWTHTQLAAELDRSPANLRRSMISDAVTARTATQVIELYERLWDVPAPCGTRAQRRASAAARARAAKQGWSPPLAWDDIDEDPDPPSSGGFSGGTDLDEVAIERAMAGDTRVRLNRAEEVEAVRRLTERGRSIRGIAETLATSPRTVSRHRRRANAA